jgi:CspA family cold shock protein
MDFRALDPHLTHRRSLYAQRLYLRLASRADDQEADPSDLDGSRTVLELTTTEAEMAVGTVKWFNATKGYGFIQPEDGGKDIFVHITAVERSELNGLTEGQRVSFDLERDRRSGKDAAVNLKSA